MEYNRSTGEVTITFRSSQCTSGSCLDLAGTILHEGVHARLFKLAADRGLDPYSTSVKVGLFPEFLREYATDNNLVDAGQHYNMAYIQNQWIEKIGDALYAYSGQTGNRSDYTGLAWSGISQFSLYPRLDLAEQTALEVRANRARLNYGTACR